MDLVESLISNDWLKSPILIEAFKKIKREDFLPDGLKDLAQLNEAIPIGFGQTISQPQVVAFMLEKLDLKPGQKVLDIGSGSGYTTALIAYVISQKNHEKIGDEPKVKIPAKAIGIEIIDELKELSQENTAKYEFLKGVLEFLIQDGVDGYKKEAPFDRILVSAAGENILPSWKEQIKIGGRIVAPVGSSIQVVIRKSENEFETETYPGFIFVPLVSK